MPTSIAMTRIALLDIRLCDYVEAERHANWALDYGRNNNLALACLAIAKKELGEEVETIFEKQLENAFIFNENIVQYKMIIYKCFL